LTRFRSLFPNGEMRVTEMRVQRGSAPSAPKLFGVSRDVTSEVETLRELDRKRAEAEAASLAKSEFVARMSHEIRTPMNGVIGMLEVLQRSTLDRDQVDHTATALKSALDLMHLLDDVIDVSRLEVRQVSVEARPFSPVSLIEDVIALFQPRAAEQSLYLNGPAEVDASTWSLGDPRRLRQVLTNLVGNGIKFTERGGITLSVTRDPASELLRFEVRDTGIGLTAETKSKLFHPFFQADTSSTRSRGGSGLGLTICRQLVELMGGEIGVESEFGRGSTFWFTVNAPIAAAPSSNDPENEVAVLPPLQILVAEDNLASQRILKALLEANGHAVTFANDGQAAVALAASQSFDVILMDVMMPVMDGPTAASRIRELGGRASGVPIIALTANALRGDRDRYLAAGMTDYLSKPIDVAALFAALTRAASV
jgi:signal transduction histidine kinase/ActR/RegA family two-component response regulator